jgi:predicted aspartyl protease
MTTRIPLKILRIENDGHHLIIRGKINRKESSLIVDTGASKSVFNAGLPDIRLKKNDIEDESNYPNAVTLATDEIPSTTGIIDELQLGRLLIKNYEATLIDMKHINELYRNISGKVIKGLIGNDLLIKYKAVVDFHNKVLILDY